MLEPSNNSELPPIPESAISRSRSSDLCGVKPHVLRYWEQEFPQLSRSSGAAIGVITSARTCSSFGRFAACCTNRGSRSAEPQSPHGRRRAVDLNQSQQLIHQMRLELEELIKILRR